MSVLLNHKSADSSNAHHKPSLQIQHTKKNLPGPEASYYTKEKTTAKPLSDIYKMGIIRNH
jgi:hypothetical protein